MLPIRKVKPTQVALTSYYNKTFVERSARKQFNYGQWLTSQLTSIGLNEEDPRVTGVKLSNVFNPLNKTPRVYAMVARQLRQFESHGIHFNWNFDQRDAFFTDAGIKVDAVETPTRVLVGHKGGTPVTMDMDNTVYVDDEAVGTLADVCGLSSAKAPIEAVDVTISNKLLPLGFVLGYQLGLSNLIAKLGCEVTRFRRGERYTLQPDEFALTFSDEVLVFTRLDTQAMFVLGGLQRFHKVLKEFSVWDFNQKDVYFNLLASLDLGVRYLREIDTLFPAWVDPITRDLLAQMGEPTAFDDLLLRAVELLLNDETLSEVDATEMRYRGYERMAGMVYGELMRSAKIYNSRPGHDHQVELKPHAVWQRIVQDPSVTLCEDVNPIQNLREQEVMTYRGDGGRSSQSMVQRTRLYSDADQGSLSESTQDSGDVGVVAYLSPNANLTSLFGTTRRYDESKDGAATLLSSSTLNAPCADRDD